MYKPAPLQIDFLKGTLAHRRQYGGGRGQLIARAVGIKPKETLTVFDATAGLGRDAFILATLGCDVLMCERSDTIAKLLEDALIRAQTEDWFVALKFSLVHADAIDYLSRTDKQFDVIYIDPMFPERTKSALVKKDMRLLREVVGDDLDSEKLLQVAMGVAKKRVVVKRARLAPTISDIKPDLVFTGKSSRFDVYQNHQDIKI